VAYRLDGVLTERWPLSVEDLNRVEPVYETYPGWSDDLSALRSLADLPAEARAYVAALEARAGVPIVLLSVGPERTQTIVRGDGPRLGRPIGSGPSAAVAGAA
jgi:adenylosuccinate synthase